MVKFNNEPVLETTAILIVIAQRNAVDREVCAGGGTNNKQTVFIFYVSWIIITSTAKKGAKQKTRAVGRQFRDKGVITPIVIGLYCTDNGKSTTRDRCRRACNIYTYSRLLIDLLKDRYGLLIA